MVGQRGQGSRPIHRSGATTGPGVINVDPDLSATLEWPEPPGSRVLNPGFQASSPGVNHSRLHPRTPGVNQNRPHPRPDAGSKPAGMPLPPPALSLGELQPRPAQPSSSSPWVEAPAGPPHRLLPSPLTGRPRSVLGGGPSRENPAAALRRGRLDARPGRGALGRQGASTTGRGGAFRLSFGRRRQDHGKKGGAEVRMAKLTSCRSARGGSSVGWAGPRGLSLWWGGAELNGRGLDSSHW